MKLSVITTLYRSRPFLDNFFTQIANVINELSINDYEIIVVNDGSPDDSLDFCLKTKETNEKIKIIDLSRNFGHHYALQAGLACSSGDYVYMTDNDLETPVSFLYACYNEISKDTTLDLVYGVQKGRKGHLTEKFGGSIFWSLFNLLSETKMPANILTECMMSRKFVNELLRMNDANLFLGGMIHWIGLNKKEIECKKGLRDGKSTYTFSKRLKLMLLALTSFSGKPLELLFYTGLTITVCSIFFIIFIITKKMIMGDEISIGWTSIIAINVLSLGLTATFLGLIGLYIYRIFKQVQGRQNYIIKQIY